MIYETGQILFVGPDDEQAKQDARDYIARMGFTWEQVKIARRPRGDVFDVVVVALTQIGEPGDGTTGN